MSYKRFTREELSKVKNISITDHMRNEGYELKPLSKKEFKIAGCGGLILSEAENVWYCFAASRGGGLIQLVMFLENMSWKEAVQDILNTSDEKTKNMIDLKVKRRICLLFVLREIQMQKMSLHICVQQG